MPAAEIHRHTDPHRSYSTRDVARLAHVSEWYVRACARDGVIDGGRHSEEKEKTRFHFDFEAVLILRMAGRLITQGASPTQVRRVIKTVKAQITHGRVTSTLFEAAGKALIAQNDGARWEPLSGQALLPFGSEPQEKKLDLISPTAERMRLALAAEEMHPEKALALYAQVLTDEPENKQAHIQLGRLYGECGDMARATAHFRQAIRLDAKDALPHFQMAVAYHDAGQDKNAIAAYRETLKRDPMFAEAHFNLAALLEELGENTAALQHLQAYRLISGRPSA